MDREVLTPSNTNRFWWYLSKLIFQVKYIRNYYMDEETVDAYQILLNKCYHESDLNVKSLLMSYIAISWDSSYLYLYQCLEDNFVRSSIRSLHDKVGSKYDIDEFYGILYDETHWRPGDQEAIECALKNAGETSTGIKKIQEVSREEAPAKWIYRLRNSIVHHTKEAILPLSSTKEWNYVIYGLLQILYEIS